MNANTQNNYAYLLRCRDGSLYGGWTNDPVKRIRSHNSGEGSKFTRSRLPVYITYLEGFDTKEEAMSREWHLKRLPREKKEALIETEGIVQLRPHHLLCIQLFEGKGYSPEFTENMWAVIERLKKNPAVILTVCCDTLCSHCPFFEDGKCRTEDKVAGFDRTVLEECGLSDGQILSWYEAEKLAREKILRAGKIRETCRDCQWGELCYPKADGSGLAAANMDLH